MNRFKKFSKYLFRTLLLLLVLLVITALLIQIPAVQKALTSKLENYLENKLQTRVDIESIRLKLPESLVLQQLYVEDLQQDTFLNVEELSLNFKLNQLLQKRIQFDQIRLSNGTGRLYIGCDSTNYDFILQAFNAVDTTARIEKTGSSSPWLLTFDAAALLLQNIEFKLQDEGQGIDLHTKVGTLDGVVKELDYTRHNYKVDRLHLKDSWIKLEMTEEECIGEPQTAEAADRSLLETDSLNYFVDVEALLLEQVVFDLKMPSIELSTAVSRLENKNSFFKMKGDDITVEIPFIELLDSKLQYELPSKGNGDIYNYQQIDLQRIATRITNFVFNNMNFQGQLESFSAVDGRGFELKRLNGDIDFAKDAITLENLFVETKKTRLQTQKAVLQYPFLGDNATPIEKFQINADVDLVSKNLEDLFYFYPAAKRIAFLQKAKNTPVKLKTKIAGSLENLLVKQLDFNGLNAQVKAKGTLKHILNKDLMALDVKVQSLGVRGSDLALILPDSMLPEFVHLPDFIALSGSIAGKLNDFQSNVLVKTDRAGAPVSTYVNAKATIKDIMNKEATYLNIQLDTFSTSKVDILAYLPPKTIPAYMSLPDKFDLHGSVSGQLDALDSELELLTYRNQQANQIKAIGNISGLFTSKNPSFDIDLNAAAFSREELMAFLPDSLFPAYFQLPFINKLSGVFKGDLNNFKTRFSLASNTGDWTVDASLKNEAYQLDLNVEDFDPGTVFQDNYLDSITGFKSLPLSIDVMMNGQGFDFSDQSKSSFKVTIKSAAEENTKGLVIDGRLDRQILEAKARAQEKGIQLVSDFKLDYTNALPLWDLGLQVDYLNLQELQITEVPLLFRGNISGNAEGYTLDTLSGNVMISDVLIDYNSKTELIDSILLEANLDNGQNVIDIKSDAFDAHLEGWFRFPTVATALRQQVANYWQFGVSDSLVGNTDDRFDLAFKLHQPGLLKLGFIPGLNDLTPFELEATFDNGKNGTLKAKTSIPNIAWQASSFEELNLLIDGEAESLDYAISFKKGLIEGKADIPDFKSRGQLKNKQLANTIQLFDEEENERFNIKSKIQFRESAPIQFSFQPKQLLNYQQWSLPEGNALSWSDKKILASNWKLFTENEAIEIRNLKDEQLEFLFRNFDLNIFDDLIMRPQINSDESKDKTVAHNDLSGIVNGNFVLNQGSKDVMFTSNLGISDLVIFDAFLGDLILSAKNKGRELIEGEATLKGNNNDVKVKGIYDVSSEFEALDFDLNVNSIALKSIEPLLFGYLENMAGTIAGDLKIRGSIIQPDLTGQLKFNDGAFDIGMLKSRLQLGEQLVVFDANAIEFKQLELKDAEGNRGIVSSYILTENYRDFYLQSRIAIKDFVILNTTSKDNSLYYGKLVVDATAELSGNIAAPIVEVVAGTQKASDLTYVYTSVSTQLESHEGIVEFVKLQTDELEKDSEQQLIKVAEELNMKVIVKMAIDEDLNFKAITDPLTGDYFEGKAKGDLVYVQNPDGTMELNGDLKIVEGKYLFTYQKFIRRPFEVKPGGTISWTNDPFNPQLDIDVNYRVRTSTYPLKAVVGDVSTEPSSAIKQTFLVNLNIGGTPLKTEINTSIEYPQVDSNINDSDVIAAIDRINQNKGQQNSQAFALILFNGFLAQDFADSDFRVIDISGNINNLITQQLNGLANRYIKFVELDIGLDTYENNSNQSTTDLRVSIRKRFLNDRLSISLDGKTSSESGQDDGDAQSYLDNVTVEYSLTPDGRFKVKIYNKRDFDDFIGGTGVKVGGAFVFSKDFNGIRLFGRNK